MEEKKLKELIEDYKHFALVLLAVGTFLYIGIWIPNHSPRTNIQEIMLIGTSTMMLASSILFFKLSSKYQKSLISCNLNHFLKKGSKKSV